MTEKSAEATRDRLVRAAAELLAEGGRDAVSTRAVSAAAGVQAPTLYRLFGDKDGLLEAVAAHGFAEYLTDKVALGESDNPVEDLRRGWDLHVQFGLTHPAFYLLMYGDPKAGASSAAGKEAENKLRRIVQRIAEAGQLRVSVSRGAELVHATGKGVVLTLIGTPEDERDMEFAAAAREHVISSITTGGQALGDTDVPARAAGLAAALRSDPVGALSGTEQALLVEWLDRIADA
ncbi:MULTISPECIES: TetR/AcrR family transcriptional regulator [unclassified Crossiella]|uniref:TetR/AcrR family transcriptional regulator n=1 Tax=unclassified Crossiella TaxID=2620835 RepID=UPI0020005910|nr:MULTISPECIES: TetR/AcrR family transcriptional regulator [unclassified Crossiella]MCK2241523.1 TetR/AcrR family transcriptional regulator [Crossiella sp. S99.2]MCK2255605.1 TetR/AcrR family transcriptional regulator [Crossiella sp. S99.1]